MVKPSLSRGRLWIKGKKGGELKQFSLKGVGCGTGEAMVRAHPHPYLSAEEKERKKLFSLSRTEA
jgi:hypothetical protein